MNYVIYLNDQTISRFQIRDDKSYCLQYDDTKQTPWQIKIFKCSKIIDFWIYLKSPAEMSESEIDKYRFYVVARQLCSILMGEYCIMYILTRYPYHPKIQFFHKIPYSSWNSWEKSLSFPPHFRIRYTIHPWSSYVMSL